MAFALNQFRSSATTPSRVPARQVSPVRTSFRGIAATTPAAAIRSLTPTFRAATDGCLPCSFQTRDGGSANIARLLPGAAVSASVPISASVPGPKEVHRQSKTLDKSTEAGLGDRVSVVESRLSEIEKRLASFESKDTGCEPKLANDDELRCRVSKLESELSSRLEAMHDISTRFQSLMANIDASSNLNCLKDMKPSSPFQGANIIEATEVKLNISSELQGRLAKIESDVMRRLNELETNCSMQAALEKDIARFQRLAKLENDVELRARLTKVESDMSVRFEVLQPMRNDIVDLQSMAKELGLNSEVPTVKDAFEARLVKLEDRIDVNTLLVKISNELATIHVDVCSCDGRVGKLENNLEGTRNSLQKVQLGFSSLVTGLQGDLLPELKDNLAECFRPIDRNVANAPCCDTDDCSSKRVSFER